MKMRLLPLLVAGLCQPVLAASDLPRVAWTGDPSTSATIGWRLLSGTDPLVKYGTTADDSNWINHPVDEVTILQHPDDAAGVELTTQLARLTNLLPDTAYYFQLCDSEGCSETRWFKTAPGSSADFTFVAGGDSRTNRQPRQAGNALVAKARPLFVLFNGDFTDDGNHEQWVNWLDDWQLAQSEDGRVYPIVATHGNHENDVIDMLSDVFGIPQTGYYQLAVGGSMMDIFSLNSELEPGVGYGAYHGQNSDGWDAQTAQFATDAAASTATWKLANYHRPMRPHTSGKSEGEGRIAAWAETFASAGFDMLIESDTHMAKYTFPIVPSDAEGSFQGFKRDDQDGFMIIGEGSWGAPTRPTDDDKPWTMDSGSFWQFKLVQASSENLRTYTVRFGSEHETLAGQVFDPSTVTALTQAEQDADAFALPAGLPLWQPLSGAHIDLPTTGFAGVDIDNLQLVGSGAQWRYFDQGSAPAGWQQADFDDSAWSQGPAQLGYGDDDEATVISYGDDADNKHITSYFRKTFSVADPADVIKLTLRLLRDDGAVVYINGVEAMRSNMPSGEITSATRASSAIGGSAEDTFYEYALLPELLVEGENSLAVEVHQSDSGSSDLSFDLDLTAVVSNIEATAADSATVLEATPVSISEIKLTWNDDASFDELGYQLERKVGDGPWQVLTWRIEADVTEYLDAKLGEGETYSYRIRPYNAAGLSTLSDAVTSQTLSNPVPKIFFEDFELGTLGSMTAISRASDKEWGISSHGNWPYMNGYGADEASDDWLITPAIALGYYVDTTLAFESSYNYDGPLLGVKYSSDYNPDLHTDPAQATWIDIPECASAAGAACWNAPSVDKYTFEATEVDVSAITAESVHFAFHYQSTGAGGGDGRGWQVDNITVRGNYQAPALSGDSLENGIPTDWTAHSGASDHDWEPGTRQDIPGVFMNGFGADEASSDWLILPSTALGEGDNAALKFDFYQKYSGPALKVMVSTDYVAGTDPATTDWADLSVELPALDDAWATIGPISLKGYSGDIAVAFVYTSTGTGGGDGAYQGVANAYIVKELEGLYQENDVLVEALNSLDGLGQFTAYSRASNADWLPEERAEQIGAVISGYSADAASDDWLISPRLDILGWQNAQVGFAIYYNYGGPELEVLISNDYAGSGDPQADDVTWTPLAVDQSQAAKEAWIPYTADVSTYTGAAHVAFRYTSTGTGSGEGRRYGVNNFRLFSTFGEQALRANFSLANTEYTTRDPVSFSATISGGEAPFSYRWDFGDGTTASEAEASHTYAAAGTYTVTLTVTDAQGVEQQVRRENLISVLQATSEPVPELTADVRVATFNAYLNRSSEGQILTDTLSGTDQQIANVAEIIQRVRPEILLLQEFDYVAGGAAVDALKANYLEVSQSGAEPIAYPHVYLAESNTGIMTEFDLDNNGVAGQGGGDAFGYGEFPGQYAMVLLSQYPILTDEVRTFQKFLWKDMPDAMLPVDPETGQSWYSDEELAVFRLSSKSHWDVPIQVGGQVLHVLASHPTPPVFDGAEDRNGTRNHDENRFWRDYVDPALSSYIYDDSGNTGGLGTDKRFVIMGDLNASSVEGDATGDPIGLMVDSAFINGDVAPASLGGRENDADNAHAPMHTADWKMRADYVLPSNYGLEVDQTAVYWPGKADEFYRLVGPGVRSSDHRLVFVDARITGKQDAETGPKDDGQVAQTDPKPDNDTGLFGSAGYGLILLAFAATLRRRRR